MIYGHLAQQHSECHQQAGHLLQVVQHLGSHAANKQLDMVQQTINQRVKDACTVDESQVTAAHLLQSHSIRRDVLGQACLCLSMLYIWPKPVSG